MDTQVVGIDMDRWTSQEGTQSPLGVTWVERPFCDLLE